jgi:hypothetical protein
MRWRAGAAEHACWGRLPFFAKAATPRAHGFGSLRQIWRRCWGDSGEKRSAGSLWKWQPLGDSALSLVLGQVT